MMDKIRQLKQMADRPSESERVQAFASILTGLENHQLEAIEEQHDVLGFEDGVTVDQDTEDRREEILELVDALANQNVADLWFTDEYLGERIDNVQDAKAYVDLDDEEWQTQISTWADSYRSAGGGEERTDREIAAYHVQKQYDVDLDTFENAVVNFEPGRAVQHIVSKRFDNVTNGIHLTTHVAKQQGDADDVVDDGGDDA
jgi:hypothetical protein